MTPALEDIFIIVYFEHMPLLILLTSRFQLCNAREKIQLSCMNMMHIRTT